MNQKSLCTDTAKHNKIYKTLKNLYHKIIKKNQGVLAENPEKSTQELIAEMENNSPYNNNKINNKMLRKTLTQTWKNTTKF